MSRATSIAGVRALGWLARACAPSAVAWRGRQMARVLRGNHGVGRGSARKRSGARPRVVQTEKVPEAGDRQRVRPTDGAAIGP